MVGSVRRPLCKCGLGTFPFPSPSSPLSSFPSPSPPSFFPFHLTYFAFSPLYCFFLSLSCDFFPLFSLIRPLFISFHFTLFFLLSFLPFLISSSVPSQLTLSLPSPSFSYSIPSYLFPPIPFLYLHPLSFLFTTSRHPWQPSLVTPIHLIHSSRSCLCLFPRISSFLFRFHYPLSSVSLLLFLSQWRAGDSRSHTLGNRLVCFECMICSYMAL